MKRGGAKRPTAWKWCSLFIRLYYSDENGYVNCATCGKNNHYKEVDCGHFRSWKHKNTQYEFKNLAPQCKHCNDPKYGAGMPYEFSLFIERTHGKGTAELMHHSSLITLKRSDFEEKYISDEYREKAKAEAKMRGIKL